MQHAQFYLTQGNESGAYKKVNSTNAYIKKLEPGGGGSRL